MKTVCDKFGALFILDEVGLLFIFSPELLTDGICLSGYEWHGSYVSNTGRFYILLFLNNDEGRYGHSPRLGILR
jgi:hypothetical protein